VTVNLARQVDDLLARDGEELQRIVAAIPSWNSAEQRYALEHFKSAREVLFEEVPTQLPDTTKGTIRVSLIEVLRS
jgi:hypothetical protein